MGSPHFVTRDVGELRCTHAWFPAGAELGAHIHDRATFGVMLEGGFDLAFTSPAIRRRRLECNPATVFTEPAGEMHGNAIGTDGASVLVLQVDPDGKRLQLGPLRALLVDRINHFRSARIATTARRLARELRTPDTLSDLAVESLALDMLVEGARQDDRWKRPAGEPVWLSRAEEHVRENLRKPLRIRDVSDAVGVHPAHLASVFRRVHRMPLATFIRRLRLEWAADRLVHSADSIAVIAVAAGFADQAHLTREFRKYTGQTPGRYRAAVGWRGAETTRPRTERRSR